jgi:hypothetical protein
VSISEYEWVCGRESVRQTVEVCAQARTGGESLTRMYEELYFLYIAHQW